MECGFFVFACLQYYAKLNFAGLDGFKLATSLFHWRLHLVIHEL